MYKLPFPGSFEEMKSELLELIKTKIGLGLNSSGIQADYPAMACSPGMYCDAFIEATFPDYAIVRLVGKFNGETYNWDEPGYLKAEFTTDKKDGVTLGDVTLVEPEVAWNAVKESLENSEMFPELLHVLTGRISHQDYFKGLAEEAPLGSGGRFAALAKKTGSAALAGWIGRKKYGDKGMAALSKHGKTGSAIPKSVRAKA